VQRKATSCFVIFFLLLTVAWESVAGVEKINLNGSWQAEKLNFYLNIKDSVFVRYQFTSISCFRGGAGYLPAVGVIQDGRLNNHYQILANGPDEIIISRPQEGISTRLTRIKHIPSHCKGQPINTPLSNFYTFWHSVNEVYHFSNYDKKNWFKVYAQAIEKFIDLDMRLFNNQNEEDLFLFDGLRSLVYELEDAHLFLIAPSLGQTVYADEQINVFNEDYFNDSERKHALYASLSEQYALTLQWFNDNNIALGYQEKSATLYLAVLSLAGTGPNGTYNATSLARIQHVATALQKNLNERTVNKLIIDLRVNDGGSIHYANILATAISHIQQTATFIAPFEDGSALQPLAYVKKGYKKLDYEIEVWVSQYTASAAEHLTLMLKGMGATIVGRETRGAYSPVILKGLPNGWIIGIPPYKIYDQHRMQLQERVGIKPDKDNNWKTDLLPF